MLPSAERKTFFIVPPDDQSEQPTLSDDEMLLAVAAVFDLPALKACAEAMFLGDGERPVATRIGAIASDQPCS